jgi:hypothetical protein
VTVALDPRTLPTGPGLSFGDNLAAWADNAALWIEQPLNLDQFAAFADSGAGAAVTAPNAPAEIGAAAGQAFDSVKAAATSTAWQLAAWGGVAAVTYLAILRLERA